MDKFGDQLKTKQTFEFTLTILTIKMPVKFPCKMNLQSDGRIISSEVQPVDGVFSFSHQVTLKASKNQNLQINAYLTTGKGSSILAGNISLNVDSLATRQGQKFTSPMQKCIDSTASVELKVNRVRVSQEKVVTTGNLAKSLAGGNIFRTTSPNPKNNSKLRTSTNQNETRSQFQGNLIKRGPSTTINKQIGRDFNYGVDAKKFNRDPYVRSKLNNRDDLIDAFVDDPRETRTIGGGSVAFQRRKQRDKEKIASKKIAEEAENNFKIDIMKYKMKSEQMEKTVNQKVKIIKELKDQILEFQRKNIQKVFMQEQLVSKDNTIKMLEDRITNVNSESTNLRETITQHLKTINQLKQNIRFDVLKNKQEYDKKQQQLKYDLNVSKNRIAELEQELHNKSSQLLKAKKYIEDLEAGAEQKIFEHDRIIQDLKKQQNAIVKTLNNRKSQLQNRVEQLTKEIDSKNQLIEKLNDRITKLENSEKNKQQLNQGLEIQKKELSAFKVDFIALSKKHAKVEQALKQQQKAHKKDVETKNKEIADLQSNNSKQTKLYESKLSTAQEKIKQLKNKTIQLDNIIITDKNQEQKLKKNIQKLERTLSEYANRINNLEKQLKSYENKLQSQSKILNQKQTSSQHMQSLHKIQLEHTKQSLDSITKEYDDLSIKYSQTKQNLELTKNERTKLENKIQLLDENVNRLNQYIKEKKQEFEQKQNELRNTIQGLNTNLKTIQQQDKKKQKQLNAWQIKELNLNNKIQRLQKTIQDNNSKIQKFEKVTIPKMHEEKQTIMRQLEKIKQKLSESIQQNKFITSERTKLESETNKNTKINSVLNEQKIMALNEVNKLKNIVAKQEKKQEKLNGELISANEQIKKLSLKIEQLNKEATRNKEILNETVNSLSFMKKSLPLSNNNISMKDSNYITTRNMATSRVVGYKSYDNFGTSESLDVRKIVQTIQSTSKQQQNTIILLQQNLNHYRQTVDKLQKELANLSYSSKSNSEKLQETIDQYSDQIQLIHEKLLSNSNEYEDKISKMQTELNKKDKDNKMHKSTIGSLKYEIESLNTKINLMIEENELHEGRANQKIDQITNQLNFTQMNLIAIQNDKKNLEAKLLNTEEQLSRQREENTRKQKFINQLTEKYNILKLDNEETNRIKKQQLQKLLSLKEELEALKDDNAKTKQMLCDQQKNNKKLQDFANDLLKQKQNIVKIELKSSSRANELEADLLQVKNISENQQNILRQKDQQINQMKISIKNNQNQIKTLEVQLKEQKTKSNQLSAKLQEKQKKLNEKEQKYKQLQTQYEKVANHLKFQLSNTKQQCEELKRTSLLTSEQSNSKIIELQKTISEQSTQINTLKIEIQQKQQQIFFEKQNRSLNQSNINELKKKNSQIALLLNKYETEIIELNQELTAREQALYQYSGKIYYLEQRIQAKEVEGDMKAEKVDIDWQCRHDQICQQYQQKIQYLQKDKQYLKDKMTLLEQEKSKLLEQKQTNSENMQKDLGLYKSRERQLEGQKLQKINQKNKQIESLKTQISNLNNQIKANKIEFKKKENQVAAKDEALKKLERKLSQNDKALVEATRKLEKQINELKKGENSLKIFKEEIKNSQWVTEREVKKITQTFIQRVINACPQAKDKLVQPIRSLESSMSSAINFKV